MATTTTNFGWDVPQSTDLVKDGATAIAALGQDIDTSMAGLKGGTTGQILSKTSGTDMAFTWIANDQGDITAVTAGTGISGGGTSGAVTITNLMATAITTAGDLIKGTGSGTFDRLGIGTSGQVLTVSGGAPVWATPAGGGGKVLQVVNAITTTTTTIASTSLTDTGITASITPTSSTSKILVIIAANAYSSANVDNTQVGAALLRGSTTLQSWDSGKNFTVFVGGGSTGFLAVNNSVVHLDSPATTSSITYKLQANTQSTANSRKVVFQESGAPGTITLMEIGA